MMNGYCLYNFVKCRKSNDAGVYQIMALDAMNQKIILSGVRYGEWHTVENIKPIPLTPEILEKAGFVKHTHNTTMDIDFHGWKYGNMILYRVHDNARSEDWFYEVEYH